MLAAFRRVAQSLQNWTITVVSFSLHVTIDESSPENPSRPVAAIGGRTGSSEGRFRFAEIGGMAPLPESRIVCSPV
jgi:hypothetical protein